MKKKTFALVALLFAFSHAILLAQNVGIGTDSPQSKLHVVGTETLAGNLNFTLGTQSIQFANPGATPNPMMYLFPSGTQNPIRMIMAHSPVYPDWGLQYNDTIDQFNFIGSGANRLAVNLSSGNVGIGVETPSQKLDIAGNIKLDGSLNFTTGTQFIQFASPGATPNPMMYLFPSSTQNPTRMIMAHSPAYPDWGLQYNDTIDQFNFVAAGSNRLAVNLASGNVGIGVEAPSQKLDIAGGIKLNGSLNFTTGTQFIQFANPVTGPAPMMYMFTTGTTNTARMVVGHSPSYPTWGLQYSDTIDQFDFVAGGLSRMAINLGNGNIGVGTPSPVYKMDVCGTIRAKEFITDPSGWCDYVFDKNYNLRSIEELENFIDQNKHLPGIVPASEVETEGLKIAEMSKAMMEKIEELSLYVVQINKINKKLEAEVEGLKLRLR